MERNNLSFDELLEAIRSDSGYKSAQEKRTAEKTTEPELPAKAEEPEIQEEVATEEPEVHTEVVIKEIETDEPCEFQ